MGSIPIARSKIINYFNMKAVRVIYTVKPEYVETNQKNITAVMDYLRDNPIEGMWYKSFLLEDGQTFMHINISKDEETLGKLGEVELFNEFRRQLKESEPLVPPKSENISPVGNDSHFF